MSNLRYANDTGIMAESEEGLQTLANSVNEEGNTMK